MLRINLIHDRAQRPPTLTQQLVWLPAVCAVLLYVGGGWLLFAAHQRAEEEIQSLREAIQGEERRIEKVKKRLSYNAADQQRVKFLAEVVRFYRTRWDWTEKLEAIGSALPEKTRLRRVEGEAGRVIRIRGVVERSERARNKIRKLRDRLEASSTFMRGLREVKWPSIQRQKNAIQFELRCVAARGSG